MECDFKAPLPFYEGEATPAWPKSPHCGPGADAAHPQVQAPLKGG
jgi:hypothetical protein